MTLDLLSGLSRDLGWLLDESDDHDIIIYAGEVPNTKGFKAHTNILRARSLYFRAVLSSKPSIQEYKNNNNHSLATPTSPVFVAPPHTAAGNYKEWYQLNISPETFGVMLKFMYSGRIDLEAESDTQKIIEYLFAADTLWLYQLLEHLQIYLIHNRSKWLQQNFVRVYSLLYKNTTTFKKLHQFTQSILFTQPHVLFDSPEYHTLTPEMIISLLKKNYVQLEESEIWAKVLEWGIRQNPEITSNRDVGNWGPENIACLQRTLSAILPLIKFEKMSSEGFNEKVRPYKSIFPVELYEKITRFQNIGDVSMVPLNPTPENSKRQHDLRTVSPSNETKVSSSKSIVPLSSPTYLTPEIRVTSVTRSTSPIVRPISPEFYTTSPEALVTRSTLPIILSPPPDPAAPFPTNIPPKPAIKKKVCYEASSLVSYKAQKNSTIISRTQLALISGWIDGRDLSSPEDASYSISNVPYKFKLLCRGSRHGFSDKMFHKRCDNQGPTVTVIKIKGIEGMIIGGYNPLNWQSPWIRKFEKCHHSFIFSIRTDDSEKRTNLEKNDHDKIVIGNDGSINRNLIVSTTPVKTKSVFSRAELSKYAISLHRSTGPAFGTTDLVLKDGIVKCKPECYMVDLLKDNGTGKGSHKKNKNYKKSYEEIFENNPTVAGPSMAHKKSDSSFNSGEDKVGHMTHRFNKSTSDFAVSIFSGDLNINKIDSQDKINSPDILSGLIFNNSHSDIEGFKDNCVENYDANDQSYLEFDEEADPLGKPNHFLVEEYEVYAVMNKKTLM
ncbi:13784_t:CDS:2 [Acaulospora morrowiae]|uniref:13784_t:CDS:1 n=1 Tax=Acaulospora morrowiae TaxID=94023 RepID=A0A9N9FTZ4_9GLOM|nr:13784_t:CDS:2 [Acaulospora morrowiae]